jgi:hypothetical protein
VQEFLRNLNHPLADVITKLRSIIHEAEPDLTEHIKWNAPSFCKNGDDRITFNFPPKRNEVLLVFHRGVAKKEVPVDKLINNTSGILQWKTNDRAVARFSSTSEVVSQKEDLLNLIKLWLQVV